MSAVTTSVRRRLEAHSFPEPMSGCWLWTSSTNTKGYGRLIDGGKVRFAHRLSYEAHIGPIPDGMFVCHHCDNPCCINPDHLFAGTPSDNAVDAARKGRLFMQRFPHESASRKLSLEDVRYIRSVYRPHQRPTQGDLARQFGVSKRSIASVLVRKTWKGA